MSERQFKEFGLEEIRSWQPCYDPTKYFGKDLSRRITMLDVLNFRDCPFQERLWVIGRYELMSRFFIMTYGIKCIEHVSDHITLPLEQKLFQDIKTFVEQLGTLPPYHQTTWDINKSQSLRNFAQEMAWRCAAIDSTQTRRQMENISWAMAYLCSNFPIRAAMWAHSAEDDPKVGIRFQEETLFKMLAEHMDGPDLY